MDASKSPDSIVYTNKAHCRDCHRCLRVCPVKAIRMKDGQAFVDAERCIVCGTCIRECPQGAKTFRNDVARVEALLADGRPVAASVAPSFAAVFRDWEGRRLPSALRSLGFAFVGETALGADAVARETARLVREDPARGWIGSACPAVVNYVERYAPDLVDRLAPVVSPMLAHARHLKARLGPTARCVFIGPCVAKKFEAEREENAGAVDAVLTFVELRDWLERKGIDLATREESDFDEPAPAAARYFPLPGGCACAGALPTDLLASDVTAAAGPEETRQALDGLRDGRIAGLLEVLFCPQGCVNGPAAACDRNSFARRGDVCRYADASVNASPAGRISPPLAARFHARAEPEPEPSEDEIRRVLEMTGKSRPEDQLDCGACGYNSCREKAVAVIRGMAEPGMCIPYMRRLAEQRTDRIIETSPNGILILDEHLNVLHMNPAFRRFFMCSESVLGQPVSYLMDPDPFERLANGGEEIVEANVRHDRYNLVCHEILYPLREENQFVGIFVNVTRGVADRETLDRLRADTVAQARELLEHQVGVAQEMARILGENTAKGERLVENLLRLAEGGAEGKDGRGNRWLWDIYTSK